MVPCQLCWSSHVPREVSRLWPRTGAAVNNPEQVTSPGQAGTPVSRPQPVCDFTRLRLSFLICHRGTMALSNAISEWDHSMKLEVLERVPRQLMA